MGLELILNYDTEKAADLVKDFIKKRYSDGLDLDCDRDEHPSTAMIIDGRYFAEIKPELKLKFHSKLCEVFEYLMKNYKYDKNDNYLEELIILTAAYRVPYASTFYENLKKSNDYANMSEDVKGVIERGILTFKQEKTKEAKPQ